MTIDKISFDNFSLKASSRASIPVINHSQPATKNIGVDMYPSLMGTFSFIALILIISSSLCKASMSLSSIPFLTSHMEDPWTLPSLISLGEDSIPTEMDMSFSTTLVAYQANLGPIVDSSSSSSRTKEEDPYAFTSWVVSSSHSHDCLDDIFPSDEAILEAMSRLEQP